MSGNKFLIFIIFIAICTITTQGYPKESPDVAVFIPQDNSYIQTFDIFVKEVKKLHDYNFILNPTGPYKHLITVGSQKTLNILQNSDFKTLFFFLVIDPAVYQEIKDREGQKNTYKISGIFFYPSPKKQLNILKELFPQIEKIGIICSKNSKILAEYIKILARDLKISVNIYESNLIEFPNYLQTSLQENDILWMIPDQKIYTPITIKQTIVSAVKMGKPIWTFSPILLRAGAFGSFKIKTEEYCQEAARIFDKCLQKNACSTTFTQKFKIILNKNLVDFWDIKIPQNLKKEIIIE